MTNNENDLGGIVRKMHESKARRYVGRLETLRVNFYVFDRNYQEILKILCLKDNVKGMLELWDSPNRQELQAVLIEIPRLLHNFLASAKSLIDQTRVVIRQWYKETSYLNEYNDQIASRFTNNSLTRFIEDLRNYNLHYALPITNATFSVQLDKETGQNTLHHSFVLVKSGLLEWSGWTKKGKAFIDEFNDNIDIGDLVNQYYKQVFDFHSWLVRGLQEIHKDDLTWYEEMRLKAINAMSEEERRDRGLL